MWMLKLLVFLLLESSCFAIDDGNGEDDIFTAESGYTEQITKKEIKTHEIKIVPIRIEISSLEAVKSEANKNIYPKKEFKGSSKASLGSISFSEFPSEYSDGGAVSGLSSYSVGGGYGDDSSNSGYERSSSVGNSYSDTPTDEYGHSSKPSEIDSIGSSLVGRMNSGRYYNTVSSGHSTTSGDLKGSSEPVGYGSSSHNSRKQNNIENHGSSIVGKNFGDISTSSGYDRGSSTGSLEGYRHPVINGHGSSSGTSPTSSKSIGYGSSSKSNGHQNYANNHGSSTNGGESGDISNNGNYGGGPLVKNSEGYSNPIRSGHGSSSGSSKTSSKSIGYGSSNNNGNSNDVRNRGSFNNQKSENYVGSQGHSNDFRNHGSSTNGGESGDNSNNGNYGGGQSVESSEGYRNQVRSGHGSSESSKRSSESIGYGSSKNNGNSNNARNGGSFNNQKGENYVGSHGHSNNVGTHGSSTYGGESGDISNNGNYGGSPSVENSEGYRNPVRSGHDSSSGSSKSSSEFIGYGSSKNNGNSNNARNGGSFNNQKGENYVGSHGHSNNVGTHGSSTYGGESGDISNNGNYGGSPSVENSEGYRNPVRSGHDSSSGSSKSSSESIGYGSSKNNGNSNNARNRGSFNNQKGENDVGSHGHRSGHGSSSGASKGSSESTGYGSSKNNGNSNNARNRGSFNNQKGENYVGSHGHRSGHGSSSGASKGSSKSTGYGPSNNNGNKPNSRNHGSFPTGRGYDSFNNQKGENYVGTHGQHNNVRNHGSSKVGGEFGDISTRGGYEQSPPVGNSEKSYGSLLQSNVNQNNARNHELSSLGQGYGHLNGNQQNKPITNGYSSQSNTPESSSKLRGHRPSQNNYQEQTNANHETSKGNAVHKSSFKLQNNDNNIGNYGQAVFGGYDVPSGNLRNQETSSNKEKSYRSSLSGNVNNYGNENDQSSFSNGNDYNLSQGNFKGDQKGSQTQGGDNYERSEDRFKGHRKDSSNDEEINFGPLSGNLNNLKNVGGYKSSSGHTNAQNSLRNNGYETGNLIQQKEYSGRGQEGGQGRYESLKVHSNNEGSNSFGSNSGNLNDLRNVGGYKSSSENFRAEDTTRNNGYGSNGVPPSNRNTNNQNNGRTGGYDRQSSITSQDPGIYPRETNNHGPNYGQPSSVTEGNDYSSHSKSNEDPVKNDHRHQGPRTNPQNTKDHASNYGRPSSVAQGNNVDGSYGLNSRDVGGNTILDQTNFDPSQNNAYGRQKSSRENFKSENNFGDNSVSKAPIRVDYNTNQYGSSHGSNNGRGNNRNPIEIFNHKQSVGRNSKLTESNINDYGNNKRGHTKNSNDNIEAVKNIRIHISSTKNTGNYGQPSIGIDPQENNSNYGNSGANKQRNGAISGNIRGHGDSRNSVGYGSSTLPNGNFKSHTPTTGFVGKTIGQISNGRNLMYSKRGRSNVGRFGINSGKGENFRNNGGPSTGTSIRYINHGSSRNNNRGRNRDSNTLNFRIKPNNIGFGASNGGYRINHRHTGGLGHFSQNLGRAGLRQRQNFRSTHGARPRQSNESGRRPTGFKNDGIEGSRNKNKRFRNNW